ncbi:DNA adenine methylase [Maridesulfovibrio ferrireducens]|uniref:DNA adenine methylase n=1 Tax=Maridesulfovibrio ferrireducens TaxID=246191 RepID=UPI001A322E37|nr:DNA adenine methylase [Maridesulfovibrio ferrireducens]MBI9113236.1 DNA adenine methylase [Maridesulfovibrio ferrireducens]
MYYSPLRYPGGKNRLSAFIGQLCVDNGIHSHYIEPFAGGGSVALFLLIEGFVEKITINDKDRSIYALWYSILNHTDVLCDLIKFCPINVDYWKVQKKIQENKNNVGLLELGYSTLYLNRTNRSGIIKAGVIGGLDQTGNYKMDCRFNKTSLIDKIKKIAEYKDHISLTNLDVMDLLQQDSIMHESDGLIYFDPPYYQKGSTLYMNHYKKGDHSILAERIKEISFLNWIVSYDNVDAIRHLYSNLPSSEFSFKHTAYESRTGKEILFFDKSLKLGKLQTLNPLYYKFDNKSKKIIVINQ